MMQAAQMIAPHMPEVEIVELHHDRKLDKPSGTAARTAELIEEAGGNVHEPIHSVRLPGLRRPPGGDLRRRGADADDPPRLDRPQSFMPGVVLACRRVGALPEPLTVGLEALLAEPRARSGTGRLLFRVAWGAAS